MSTKKISELSSSTLPLSGGEAIVMNQGGDTVTTLLSNIGTYIGNGALPSLSSNWQNTYTSFSSASANWQNAYTTVSPTSANWQNTYTSFSSASANFAVKNATNTFTEIQHFEGDDGTVDLLDSNSINTFATGINIAGQFYNTTYYYATSLGTSSEAIHITGPVFIDDGVDNGYGWSGELADSSGTPIAQVVNGIIIKASISEGYYSL